MKFKFVVLVGLTLIVLSACNGETNEEENTSMEENSESVSTTDEKSEQTENPNENESNLVKQGNVEPGWINFTGEVKRSKDYVVTSGIDYNSNVDYKLSHGAYISYFEEDKFIKTVLQNEAGIIEQVENADTLRLSFHKSFSDVMNLTKQ